MSVLKIAFLQISPCGDERQNAIKGEKYCRIAKEKGADIALFPEMFSCGYNIASIPRKEWNTVSEDGQFLIRCRPYTCHFDYLLYRLWQAGN